MCVCVCVSRHDAFATLLGLPLAKFTRVSGEASYSVNGERRLELERTRDGRIVEYLLSFF